MSRAELLNAQILKRTRDARARCRRRLRIRSAATASCRRMTTPPSSVQLHPAELALEGTLSRMS
eukprot:4393060-Pleurochrysis_carterae.AAC.1